MGQNKEALRDELTKPPEEYVGQGPRVKLVEQRATNAQTVAFVAGQQETIAEQAEALAKEHPALQEFAERERANRDRLEAVMEVEKRLATAIQFEFAGELALAAQLREHRMEMLEVARAEGRIADELEAHREKDPQVEAMAEQARRNRDLLLHVAATEREASVSLRGAGEAPEDEDEEEEDLGICATGSGIASGMGIGQAMAMLEVAQDLPVEDDPPH